MAFVKFTGGSFRPDLKPEPKEKAKKKKIRSLSIKRENQNKDYLLLRKLFLKDKRCQCGCSREAVDVHHQKGRIGDLLCNVKFWLAVCREHHKEIEENPVWAKKMGYSLDRISI